MLSHSQKKKLKASWGDQADSLSCKAEVRVCDPLSHWECYIYAINPQDEDEACCIIKTGKYEKPTFEAWNLTGIDSLFNSEGEGVEIDSEYRPLYISNLIKKLEENTFYES